MESANALTKFEDIPCYPELAECPPSDVIDLRPRLLFPVRTETRHVTLNRRFSRNQRTKEIL
jgi:hypothetical protein